MVLIIVIVLNLIVAVLMFYNNSVVVMAIQTRIVILRGLGTTFEAEGVNINLAYLSVSLSIIIGVLTILGGLLLFTKRTVKNINIGLIVIIGMTILSWIGIFIPIINTSFTVSPYTFYIDIDLVETLIGIGEPILLSISSVIALFSELKLS